jgi:hypothetical protein
LIRSIPHSCQIGQLFTSWPGDQSTLLQNAQTARDALTAACKDSRPSPADRLKLVDAYLPLAVSISNVLTRYPTITITQHRLKWTQTPIVTMNYRERNFNGSYWHCEILHLVWLRGILLIKIAATYDIVSSAKLAVSSLREAAGIFQWLAQEGTAGLSPDQIPLEFQSSVLNSLVSLSLGEAYSIMVVGLSEDPQKFATLAKVCFAAFVMFSTAAESIQTAPPGLIHPQFQQWLLGGKLFLHANAAIYLALISKSQEETGKGIAIIRLAIQDLTGILEMKDKIKCARLDQPAAILLERIRPVDAEWGAANFRIFNQYVPVKEEAERLLVEATTALVTLPQPIPFVLPSA